MHDHEAVFPSTQASASSPRVDAAYTGVRLAAPTAISPRDALVVSGVFQLPEEDARRIDARPHRALVIVVMTSGSAWATFTPFREIVLFDDDVEIAAGRVRGHFTARLLDGAERALFAGDYHVHASLGELVSDAVTITVR